MHERREGGWDTQKREYKEAKWTVKKSIVEAKSRADKEFYQKLDIKERKRYIFKMVKARSMQKQDLQIVKYIKDEGGRVLLRQEDIKLRWR